MNGYGSWFRQFTMKIAYAYRRFMEGRYGTDRLNMTILTTGLVLCIVSMFFRIPAVNLTLPITREKVSFYWHTHRMRCSTRKRSPYTGVIILPYGVKRSNRRSNACSLQIRQLLPKRFC